MDIILNFIGFNETLHIAISIVLAYLCLEFYTLTWYSFGQDPEERNGVNGIVITIPFTLQQVAGINGPNSIYKR